MDLELNCGEVYKVNTDSATYKKLKRRKTMKRLPDKYKSTVKQLKEGKHKSIDLTGAGKPLQT